MHEMSIAQGILEIVSEEIRRHGNVKVSVVNISVGKFTAVVPGQLAFCFSLITPETELAGAVLNIREVPFGYLCSSCGKKFSSGEALMECPECGGEDPVLTSGRELTIDSIEVAD